MASLVCLPGDLLAAIFVSLAPADRKALYHTHPSIWKNPVVNSHVDTTTLSVLPDSPSWQHQLACFPRHAAPLKALTMDGSLKTKQAHKKTTTKTTDPGMMLQQLLSGPTRSSSEAMARLSTVEHLTFEGCQLSEDCAPSVAHLFSKLSSSGSGCVVFNKCSGFSKFLSALGPQVRVRELIFDNCSFSHGFERAMSTFGECLEMLTLKTNVRTVDYGGFDSDDEQQDPEEYTEVLMVSAFKGLSNLQTLHVYNYTVVGLSDLLRAVPLKALWLAGQSGWREPSPGFMDEMAWMGGMEGSGSGMDESEEASEGGHATGGSQAPDESQEAEESSDSLEFLHVGIDVSSDLSLSFVSARFPALKELQLCGIRCMGTVSGSSDEARLQQLLSWLTAMPLLTVGETFTIEVSYNRFAEHIVSALMPSPLCLMEGKRLVVCTQGRLTFALIDTLSSLPYVSKVREVQLEARGADVQKVDKALTRFAMVEAVQKFPLTRLVVHSNKFPGGVMATLLMAVQLRREPFNLDVSGKELLPGWHTGDGDMSAHELNKQWLEVQRTAGIEGVSNVNLKAVIHTKQSEEMWG